MELRLGEGPHDSLLERKLDNLQCEVSAVVETIETFQSPKNNLRKTYHERIDHQGDQLTRNFNQQ